LSGGRRERSRNRLIALRSQTSRAAAGGGWPGRPGRGRHRRDQAAGPIAGQPTIDRESLAEAIFPYPHLEIARTPDSQVVLTFDDGTVLPAGKVIYQVPANGEPIRAGDPICDTTDMICWGTTTVDPTLSVRIIELEYMGTPCVLAGSRLIEQR
jgi:hypothetical protein